MLRLEKVFLSLGVDWIFSRLNLEVSAGESIVIIGPSGAGKSLLLKLASGLIPPTRGKVYLFGENLFQIGFFQRQNLLKKIGFSFQQSALFDFLSVEENIGFTLRAVLRWEEEKIKERVSFLIKAMGLEGAEKKMPEELSGGMKKRVSLARALAHSPQLLFCDDPTSGLDPITSAEISELILRLKKEANFTLILVSNHLPTIRKLAKKVFLLYRGSLSELGSAQEIEFNAEKWSHFLEE